MSKYIIAFKDCAGRNYEYYSGGSYMYNNEKYATFGRGIKEANTHGHSWSCKTRPRNTTAPTCNKQRWVKVLNGGDKNDPQGNN